MPRVILFREEHTRRVFVPKVDFISAPGTSAPNVYRPGGPWKMVTGLGVFGFDRARKRFAIESVHPGHTVEEILDNTGFTIRCSRSVPVTSVAGQATLALLRGRIREEIAETYPRFASQLALSVTWLWRSAETAGS